MSLPRKLVDSKLVRLRKNNKKSEKRDSIRNNDYEELIRKLSAEVRGFESQGKFPVTNKKYMHAMGRLASDVMAIDTEAFVKLKNVTNVKSGDEAEPSFITRTNVTNNLSALIKKEIAAEDQEQRLHIIRRWLLVADVCLKKLNYACANAIISGIDGVTK